MQMVEPNSRERGLLTGCACPSTAPLGGVPQAKRRQRERPEESMECKETACGRRAHSLGWCTTHYRRRSSGKPMNAPIRRYARRVGPKREKPFAAEWALLR